MIALPAVAPTHMSAKYVFTHFNDNPGSGIYNNFYIFILGLLMSQFTLTGCAMHLLIVADGGGRVALGGFCLDRVHHTLAVAYAACGTVIHEEVCDRACFDCILFSLCSALLCCRCLFAAGMMPQRTCQRRQRVLPRLGQGASS